MKVNTKYSSLAKPPFEKKISPYLQWGPCLFTEVFVSNASAKETPAHLGIWRNNFYAHKSPKNVLNNYKTATDYPLTYANIEELLFGGMKLINRYSNLFRALTSSDQIVGHDDYRFVLDSIKMRLDIMEQDGYIRKMI